MQDSHRLSVSTTQRVKKPSSEVTARLQERFITNVSVDTGDKNEGFLQGMPVSHASNVKLASDGSGQDGL